MARRPVKEQLAESDRIKLIAESDNRIKAGLQMEHEDQIRADLGAPLVTTIAEKVEKPEAAASSTPAFEDVRRRMPDERVSLVRKLQLPPIPQDPVTCPTCNTTFEPNGNHPLKIYAIPGFYEDGGLGELFLRADKVGSFVSGILDGLAMVVSVALQHGVPVAAITDKFVRQKFEPAGVTGDAQFPIVSSVLDYLGRWMRTLGARNPGAKS